MRLLVAAGLLVGGALVGLATVALHELWWGLPLSVAALAPLMVALPAGWWARLAFALGFGGLIGWLMSPRPEGDYVISSDVRGYLLLSLALVVFVAAVATLPRPGRRTGSVRN